MTAGNVVPGKVRTSGDGSATGTNPVTVRWFRVVPLSLSEAADGARAHTGVPHFIVAIVANDSVPCYPRADDPHPTQHDLEGDVAVLWVANSSGRTITLQELLPGDRPGRHPMTVIPLPRRRGPIAAAGEIFPIRLSNRYRIVRRTVRPMPSAARSRRHTADGPARPSGNP